MKLECFSALPEGNENFSHSKRFSAGQMLIWVSIVFHKSRVFNVEHPLKELLFSFVKYQVLLQPLQRMTFHLPSPLSTPVTSVLSSNVLLVGAFLDVGGEDIYEDRRLLCILQERTLFHRELETILKFRAILAILTV